MTRLFHQSIIKINVVLIFFAIKYNINFTFESSIFRSYHHCCSNNKATTEVRYEHQKTGFITRICWLQWGRQTEFRKSSVSWSPSHNITGTSQSRVWASCERGVFSTKILISLLGTASCFGWTTRCIYLIWSLRFGKDSSHIVVSPFNWLDSIISSAYY